MKILCQDSQPGVAKLISLVIIIIIIIIIIVVVVIILLLLPNIRPSWPVKVLQNRIFPSF
jgi:hypothetical protein